MKKIKLVLVIFLLMTLLAGCGNKITEGEVYEKEFKPEDYVMVMTPVTHSDGKNFSMTWIPIMHHYPERWCIRIRSIEKNEDGEYEKAEYYTTEEVYNNTNLGDIFSYEPERDFEEEPDEKKKVEQM